MRLSREETQYLDEHYRPGMTAQQLARSAGCSLWLAHGFLAGITFEEVALALYGAGFSGPAIAVQMETTCGRVYYHLHKVMKSRGLRWLKELRSGWI